MFKVMITAAAALTAVATVSGEPSPAERLETLFDSPPQMRGANAWWHWQGANVTKSGITRDLQSMRDARRKDSALSSAFTTAPDIPPREGRGLRRNSA